MAEHETLAGLLKRVETSTGPDPKLDRDIKLAMAASLQAGSRSEQAFEAFGGLRKVAPAYTASVDAAVALVERALPGTMWAAGNAERGAFCRLVWHSPSEPSADPKELEISETRDRGPPTAPLAILASLLTAILIEAGYD